mmetsp:Transcript_496/g.894  ORF Transcript_496/g.894 Transcript_496/m.894 type:complete len:599 (-) Transcript_496:410-2206(-)
MVELRLESIEERMMPKDVFISVRVGDTQKLSRLAATRNYRFPQAGDRRYGKIEVFKRIGACSVDIDPSIAGAREVNVNCEDAGFGSLGLKIGVEADEAHKKLEDEKASTGDHGSKKAGTKVKAAKEYLSKHGLEVRLSEAMQSVLRDRPENPTEYLAMKLLGKSAGQLPPLQGGPRQPEGAGMPAYQQDRSLPTDDWKGVPQNRPRQLEPLTQPSATAKAKPSAGVLPFKSYYAQNFKTITQKDCEKIYSQFPAPKKPEPKAAPPVNVLPFKEFYQSNFKSSGVAAFNNLYKNFPRAEAKPEKLPVTASVLPFDKYYKANILPQTPKYLLTVYAKFPNAASRVSPAKPGASGDINALREQAREAIVKASLDGQLHKALQEVRQPQAPLPTFSKRASVGTWLMLKPTPVKPTPWFKKPSVGTWISAKPLFEDGVKVGLAETKSQATSEDAKGGFAQYPSVGTWCQPRLGAKPSSAKTTTSGSAQQGTLEATRLRVKNMLEDAANDGSLLDAIRNVKSGGDTTTETPFKFRPSVGSWLCPLKKPKGPPPRSFQFRPSVGTWLAVSLPKEPEPPKPLVLSSRLMLGPSSYSMGVRPGVRIL